MKILKFSSILLGGLILIGGPAWCAPAEKTATPKAQPSATDEHTYARALGDTFADISQKVSPAVVVINVWYPDEPRDDTPDGQEGVPFEFFFPQPRGGPHRPGGPPRVYDSARPDSQGSGFIVSADGYIYTNNHVIDKADRIEVKLKDGERISAKVVGVDPNSDVAVLKIDAKQSKSPLSVAEMGDSDGVRVGEWAIAIGAPFGLEYSVTVGVVSAKGRTGFSMDASKPVYEDYIQTDATINPGNSGGPLVNIEGKVIGINTLIRTSPAMGGFFNNTNTGFAIPINMAHKNARQIISQGRVIRPWLGVKIQSVEQLSPEVKNRLRGVASGAMIQGIDPDTPASKSDLKPFDVVIEIDGVKIASAKELQAEVLNKKVGQTVKLAVVREGKTIKLELKTGELPSPVVAVSRTLPREDAAPSSGFGFTVQPLNEALAKRFNVPLTSGLVISNIDSGSAADAAGLMPGDVVTEVDYKEIRSIGALKKALTDSDPDKGALIHLMRQGTRVFTVLKKNATAAPKGDKKTPPTPAPEQAPSIPQ